MDKDVKLLLDWLYLHRKEWLSAFQIMEGTQMSLDPFMIEWLVKNDLLTEVSVDSSSVYRISLGGIMNGAFVVMTTVASTVVTAYLPSPRSLTSVTEPT